MRSASRALACVFAIFAFLGVWRLAPSPQNSWADAAQDAGETRVVCVFQRSQRPASGAVVEILHQNKAGRTDDDGICVLDGTGLDAIQEYYFLVRLAGYRREYIRSIPGQELRFELVRKYGPPVPED